MKFLTLCTLIVFFFASESNAQIEVCPCEPNAIDCPCPIDTDTGTDPPTTTTPIAQCGDVDYSNLTIDSDDWGQGFALGRTETIGFSQAFLASCLYNIAGFTPEIGPGRPNLLALFDYVTPSQIVTLPTTTPGSPFMVPANDQIAITSEGNEAACSESLRNDMAQISRIIAEKINEEIAIPGSTGRSLSFWLGFCDGFESAQYF